MADAELRAKATGKGFKEVAAGIDKVAAAQKKVVAGTKEGAGVTRDAAGAQDELTSSSTGLLAVLIGISPRLGAMATILRDAFQSIGNLGTKVLSVKGIAKSATGTFSKFAGTIKLLGAAGVAFAGSKALFNAIQDVREASEQAEQSIQKMIDRLTEAVAASQAGAKEIAGNLDTKPAKTPITFAQEQSVAATLEATPKEFRDIIKPILEEFGGAKGFGSGAGEFTGGELLDLARLSFKVLQGATQAASVNAGRAFLDERSGGREVIARRDRDRRAATNQRAAEEAIAGGEVGTPALDAIIGPLAEQLGVDSDRVRELALIELQREFKTRRGAQRFPEASRDKFLENNAGFPGQRIEAPDFKIPFIEGSRSALGTPFIGEGDDRKGASPTEVAAVDEIFRRLLPILEKMADEPRVVIQHDGRYFAVDATAQAASRQNSEDRNKGEDHP